MTFLRDTGRTDPMSFLVGQMVSATCNGETVEAEIVIASDNARSLGLSFVGVLDGHAGSCALLLDEGGEYRMITTQTPVSLELVDP